MIIREATVNDAEIIVELVNKYAKKGLMLSKTLYKVYTTIQNFFVAEDKGKIVGCVSLSILWKDLCEVSSLAVSDDYKGKGIGRKLVESCIERAKKLKVPKIIALTYEDKFFEKIGFKFTEKDQFPRKLWRECLECPKLEQCDELAYVYNL